MRPTLVGPNRVNVNREVNKGNSMSFVPVSAYVKAPENGEVVYKHYFAMDCYITQVRVDGAGLQSGSFVEVISENGDMKTIQKIDAGITVPAGIKIFAGTTVSVVFFGQAEDLTISFIKVLR